MSGTVPTSERAEFEGQFGLEVPGDHGRVADCHAGYVAYDALAAEIPENGNCRVHDDGADEEGEGHYHDYHVRPDEGVNFPVEADEGDLLRGEAAVPSPRGGHAVPERTARLSGSCAQSGVNILIESVSVVEVDASVGRRPEFLFLVLVVYPVETFRAIEGDVPPVGACFVPREIVRILRAALVHGRRGGAAQQSD